VFDDQQAEPMIIRGDIAQTRYDREKLTPSSEVTWAPREKSFSLDCGHNCYRTAPVNGKIIIAPDEPLYLARVVRNK
jgi:hypothetical protein